MSQVIEHSSSSLNVKQVLINRTNQDVITEEIFVNENSVVEASTIAESEETDIEIEEELKPNLPPYTSASSVVKSTTNNPNGYELDEIVDEIVQWRKKLFKLPSGNAAKMFIRELTSWLEHFNCDSEYKSIALKVHMILPSLLLQKPTRNSKAKDHTKKLEERLSTWKGGRIMDLVKEG